MDRCWCGNSALENYSKDYYVCRECGTLVTKRNISRSICNVEDEENDLYGKNYWTNKMLSVSKENGIDNLIQTYIEGRVLYWMRYILQYIPIGSSVAEVGCGLGQLAYLMKSIGYQQRAYEISPEICDFLRHRMKLNVVCGEFGTINEIYEAILTFDLLEHLLEPQKFIKECADRLWGREILCCQTPCYTEEWSYEEMLINKPEFADLLVPDQHIYIFSKRSVEKLLKESGFNYISFEKPAFGENYDMFLFASKKPMELISQNRIKTDLINADNGRMVIALLNFFNRLNG